MFDEAYGGGWRRWSGDLAAMGSRSVEEHIHENGREKSGRVVAGQGRWRGQRGGGERPTRRRFERLDRSLVARKGVSREIEGPSTPTTASTADDLQQRPPVASASLKTPGHIFRRTQSCPASSSVRPSANSPQRQ